MPREETIYKITALLRSIKTKFKTSKGISLSKMLRSQKVPHDYTTIFVEVGALKKLSRGSRGATQWEWNDKFKINKESVIGCINMYNKKRLNEVKGRQPTKAERITFEKRLSNLEEILKKILDNTYRPNDLL